MKLVTSNNWLTDYALSCGYLETNQDYQKPMGASIEKLSNSYIVSVYDHANHVRLYSDTFFTISDARKAFSEVLKEHGLKRKIPTEY